MRWCCNADESSAVKSTMTSKNSGVSGGGGGPSTTMSSLGKVCLQLSHTIKDHVVTRQGLSPAVQRHQEPCRHTSCLCSTSTTMSSLGKACLELSKSIKSSFRFSRQSSPPPSHDQAGASAVARPPATAEDGSVCDDVASGLCEAAPGAVSAGGGSSVTSTISRVIRSATNRVRAFPASPSLSPHHHHHPPQPQQPGQAAVQPACNAAVNGHGLPPAPPAPPPLGTPPPLSPASRTRAPRCIPPPAGGGNADLWHDEQFLLRFFRYFSAVERCVLAQVGSRSLAHSRTKCVLYPILPPCPQTRQNSPVCVVSTSAVWIGFSTTQGCRRLKSCLIAR